MYIHTLIKILHPIRVKEISIDTEGLLLVLMSLQDYFKSSEFNLNPFNFLNFPLQKINLSI
jgi:hypothetical protein